MNRAAQLLDRNTTDGFGNDEPEDLGFDLADLSVDEKAEYTRLLGEFTKRLEARRRSRRDEVDAGMTIHGPGYHDEPYCGGY